MIAHSPASTWRDPILAQFTPDIATVARLTVVADPDELLTEQGVIDGIRQRGFEIVPFEDHVAFRYAYERRFREVWDNGKDTNLVVVLRATRSDISGLPFDLLEQAKRDRRLLSFSLAELFPSLAPHVLSELDRGDLDAVSAAQQLFKPEPLGENATRDFLLRHVFRLDPAQIQDDAELLRALLRRHYSAKVIPKSLDDRLIHLLRSTDRWQEWPLDQIVPSRANFLEFLQERWPIFVRQRLASPASALREEAAPYDLQFSGPVDLPFDHDDVRVYVDNLFTDGLLAPVGGISHSLVAGSWMAVGVAGSAGADQTSRFRKLLQLLQSDSPSLNSDHQAWIQAATRWAEVVALRWSLPEDLPPEDKVPLRDRTPPDRAELSRMDGCALWRSAQPVVSTTTSHASSDTEVHGASACGEGAGTEACGGRHRRPRHGPVGCCPPGDAVTKMAHGGVRALRLGADADVSIPSIDLRWGSAILFWPEPRHDAQGRAALDAVLG